MNRDAPSATVTAASDDTDDKKRRIYEVAREFNLSSVAMVEVVRGLGFRRQESHGRMHPGDVR